MHLSLRLALGISIVVGLSGCTFGRYRVVKKVPNGGEVALEGMQDEARQKADAYMKTECAQGYDVLEEGEQVVGQHHSSSSEARPTTTLFGGKSTTTNTNATSSDVREWRIKYQCKGTAPATEKAAPPADPAKKSQIKELIVRF